MSPINGLETSIIIINAITSESNTPPTGMTVFDVVRLPVNAGKDRTGSPFPK